MTSRRAGRARRPAALAVASMALAGSLGANALEWPNRSAAALAAYDAARGDADARARVFGDLAQTGASPDSAAEVVIAGLGDPAAAVRAAAATAAGELGVAAAAGALLQRLTDRDPAVRAAACEALAAVDPTGAGEPVARLLSDPSADVRVAVVRALAATGDSSAAIALSEALRDRSRDVVVASLDALRQLGVPSGIHAVLERVDDPIEDVAVAAIEAAGALGASEAVPALATKAADDRPRVAIAAIRSLGSLGDAAAVPALVSQVLSPRPAEVRVAAIEALAAIGDPAGLPPLTALLEAEPGLVGPYFAAAGPAAWPTIRAAVARTPTSAPRYTPLVIVWLRSGDAEAVAHVSRGGGEATALLRESPTPQAVCAAITSASGLVDREHAQEWADWAAAAGAVDCAADALRLAAARHEEAVGVVTSLAPTAPAFAAELAAAAVDVERLDAGESGRLLASFWLSAAGHAAVVPLASRMLVAADERVRRDGAVMLAESEWSTVREVALSNEAAGYDERLVVLGRGVEAGDSAAVAAARAALQAGASPTSAALALDALRQGCAADLDWVVRQRAAEALWLRRAATEYALDCGTSGAAMGTLGEGDVAAEVDVARDRSATTAARVAAIGALRGGGALSDALVLELARDANEAVAAAAWALSGPGVARQRVAALWSERSAAVRAGIAVALDPTERVQRLNRGEPDPAVRRVLEGGAPLAGWVRVVVLVDERRSAPDVDVWFLRADGSSEVRSTGPLGMAAAQSDGGLAPIIAVFPTRRR
ncbi:MAG: HEAT repeat domain-containing protein [Myxococcales bacterium]|nr:HEAT repeat domain-containing protein [Myxococcales bacterium]